MGEEGGTVEVDRFAGAGQVAPRKALLQHPHSRRKSINPRFGSILGAERLHARGVVAVAAGAEREQEGCPEGMNAKGERGFHPRPTRAVDLGYFEPGNCASPASASTRPPAKRCPSHPAPR